MNEPQVWSLIGVFAASMVALVTIVIHLIRAMSDRLGAQIEALRAETSGQIESLRSDTSGQIASLRADTSGQIESLRAETRAQFETVRTRMDHLDRDIQAMARRVFPD